MLNKNDYLITRVAESQNQSPITRRGKRRCPEIGPNTASPEKRHKVVKQKTNRLKMPPSQPVFLVRKTLMYPTCLSISKK